MKISTNLVSRPGKIAPHIAVGLWVLSAMLILYSAVVWFRIGQLYQQIPALQTRLEQFGGRHKGVDALPPRDELIALKDSIASINQLSGSHNGSLLSALVRLEAQLPNNVSLDELNYRRRAGEIRLIAHAGRSEAVGKLLQDMERSGDFSEVLLVRQSSDSDSQSGRVQFEISLKERP